MKICHFLTMILLAICANLDAQNFDDYFYFYLPANDTTQQRFLPPFPIQPIEANDFVTIDNQGHFAVRGQRIRFFGTNSVAAGAFPDQSNAWFVAGRLRKMGFNLIRFHHLDNGWSRESLFEWNNDTRHLNPETLDRLEKFIAELKRNGIFINMNLHVSRTFNSRDGVPHADSILNFGKGVTYFDPQLIELQKEYAEQLLTHRNPYTGLALKDDPVMAMVEITNENSLYRMWRDGSIRARAAGGDFPTRHVKLLDQQWQQFLQEKYTTTQQLHEAWDQGTREPGNTDQIKDGGFETAPIARYWVLEQHEAAKAKMFIDDSQPFSGSHCARVEVTNVDGTNWHIQWKQVNLTIEQDSLYTVTFAGRSEVKQNISVNIQRDVSPWNVFYSVGFQLTPQWQKFQFSFRASETSQRNVRLSFVLGGATGNYWFDEIHLAASAISGLETDESLETGTVRRIAFSECVNFSDPRVSDMSAFYIQLSDDYLTEMANFLKGTLGVRVPLVGTNWNIGPGDLVSQSQLDYLDNHAYWDHPQFPNQPWSATDWKINNQPMVNDNNSGTMARLLGGVGFKGKPFTVSEYNHAFPNRYQTEGMLFLSGYASFHDLDGLMFFDYGGSRDDWETDQVNGYFSIHRNTAMMALVPSCAHAFRTGMIAPARETIELAYSPADILLLPKNDSGNWSGPELYPQKLALQHAVRNVSFNSHLNFDPKRFPAEPTPPYQTDTGEIIWNTTGLLTVTTDQFVGLSGFLNNFSGHNAGALSLKNASGFATLTWVSFSGNPLTSADRSLITLSTKIQNTDMIWDGTSTLHNNWGKAPTQMYPVVVRLGLNIQADSIRVFPLDETGNKMGPYQTYLPVGKNQFEITCDQYRDETVWWGIEKWGLGVAVPPNQSTGAFPAEWNLLPNFPNPFNARTHIHFQMKSKAWVQLEIFNLNGQRIRTLLHAEKPAGTYSVMWDGTDDCGRSVSSGIYFCQMKTLNYCKQQKLLLVQ